MVTVPGMTVEELQEKVEQLKPVRIRPYLVDGDEIKLLCSMCDEWLFAVQFTKDGKTGSVIPYKSYCKACQNEINKNSKRYLAKHTPTKRKEKK